MKAGQKKKAVTFGEFITHAHDTWGDRQASGMVRLAVNARLVKLQGPQGFVFAQAESQLESQSHEHSP